MRLLHAGSALALLACGSSGSGFARDGGVPDTMKIVPEAGGHDGAREAGGHDASVDAAPAYPAAHPAMPQEVNLGGPVMKHPKFVILTFAGDPLAPQIDDFVAKVAASKTYWSGTTAEYGVGPVASVLDITLNETPKANLTDGDIQSWLSDKLSGSDAGTLEGGAPWPQPDGETLYMIYYPYVGGVPVNITQGGGSSCSAFYGYHNDYMLAGTYLTYSVVARCPPFPMTSAIDSITAIASHELVEAATDPEPVGHPAWASPDFEHLAWELPAGGELGDMCAGFGDVFYEPSDVPYLVQRTWSNQAAAAGHDPCQPGGAKPYFNSAVVVTQNVTDDDPVFGTFTQKGIKIPVGGTGTVELDLYSDAPTSGPWTVQAFDISSLMGGPAELEFGGTGTFKGKNADRVTLDIKVKQAGQGGAELLWIQSSMGQTQSVWLALVGH